MSALFDENNNIVSGTLNIGSGNIYDIILSDTSGNATVFNQNNLDIDFAVSGTGNTDVLFYDASTGRLGINVDNPDSALHVVTDCALDGLKIESETNCATGVRILFLHNPQTAPESGSYPVTVDLAGRDENYNTINYAQIKSRIIRAETSNTQGEIIFTVDQTGVNQEVFRSSITETVLGGLNDPSGSSYNVLGYANTPDGSDYVILGNTNDSFHNTGIIIGNNNSVSGHKVVFLGNNSSLTGTNALAILVDSSISGDNSISIGHNLKSSGVNVTLIGHDNTVQSNNFMALVNNADISGNLVLGFGDIASVTGNMPIYIGHNINISGDQTILVGSNVNNTGNNNIIYGHNAGASGNNIISIGHSNTSYSTTSGISIGNNIISNNSEMSVVIGLNNNLASGLKNGMIVGLNNTTYDSRATGLVLFGESNTIAYVKDSLVIGNANNLSGNLLNNIVLGPRNSVPTTSRNNLLVGILNNITGIVINSDGSITGTDIRADGDNMTNTNVFGINNWVSVASGSTVIGNKGRFSGLNINTVGSYTNINGNNNENLGNSNFILGDNNVALGNKNDILGTNSFSVNTRSEHRNQIFGSGNIVIGHNEVIVSGISLGFDNEIYGPRNIVIGDRNDIGLVRYPCRVSGSNVVIDGAVDDFIGGDSILIGIYSPPSQDNNVYVGTILDGTDVNGDPLGVITENLGGGFFTTTLVISPTITPTNTIEYYTKDHFDDIIQGENPCDVCFADLYAGYSSGYVMAFRKGGDDTDLFGNPRYGNNNIVLGNQNEHKNGSGIVIGNQNTTSGTKNVVIGYNISGNYNNTVQIGTNNDNKILFNDDLIIFNTGGLQSNLFIATSASGVGDNNDMVQSIDLINNRVGINKVNPAYTLDVDGSLRTNKIFISDGAASGYALISNGYGSGSWQLPVYLSGSNSGLLFKTSSKVGSGIREIFFNVNSGVKSLEYLRANRLFHPSYDLETGFTEDRALIINQTGLFLNQAGNDYGYNFEIRGSGIQDEIAGDNSVYLFKTNIPENSVRMHNILGASGTLNNIKINSGVVLPTNLTGTVLKVNNDGSLTSNSYPRHSLPFVSSSYGLSGNTSLRYYADTQALAIGTTGEVGAIADSSLQQGSLNTWNHAIIGGAQGINTVFNHQGKGNTFSVIQSGQAGAQLGLHYKTHYGALGIGVAESNLWNVSSTSINRPWWEAGALVVNGKIRATGLQLTAQGVTLPGAASLNKYLKIIDVNGNVGLDTLDLDYQFSGLHPLAAITDEGNSVVTIKLDIEDANGVSLAQADSTSSNGIGLVWNGSKWVHSRGYRFYQPENGSTNTDASPGIELGNDLSLNSCRNNHVAGAGSFARGVSNFKGSSQNSTFYLRGRTGGVVTSELTADWHKNANTTPDPENTISLQFLESYEDGDTNDHNRTMVWNYTVNYSAVFSDDASTPTFGAAGGKVEGTILSYIASDGTRTTTKLSGETITKRYSTADYSSTSPISVEIIDQGADLNQKRLAIKANGAQSTPGSVALNGLWSVVVEINQVHMPSGITFGDSSIA